MSHEMGRAYERAALLCLSGEFGMDKDDKHETVLARMFELKVLQQLELGTEIDGT